MTETPDAQGGQSPADRTPAAGARAPRPAPRPLPSPLGVITAALGLFFVVLTLLAIQVRNGRDPALGPGPAVPAVSGQPLATGQQAKSQQVKQATTIVSRTSPVPP